MKPDTLIIVFTIFDDYVFEYLSAFQIQVTEDINLLGIGFKDYVLNGSDNMDVKSAFPILLIKDDNYTYQVYSDEIKTQIDLHQKFILVLHASSLYKTAQMEGIFDVSKQKLQHPIKLEHHDSGPTFEFLKMLATVQDEITFVRELNRFVQTFQLDAINEAKLYLLNSVNTPLEAELILQGKFDQCMVELEVEKLIQIEELREALKCFSQNEINTIEFKKKLIKIFEKVQST